MQAITKGDRQLNAVARASIADDIFNLARCGLVPYTLVYRLLRIWSTHETEYASWKAVVDNLEDILFVVQASPTEQSQRIQRLIENEIVRPFRQIMQSPVRDSDANGSTDDLKTILTRLACATLRLADCTEGIRLEYERILATSANLTLSGRLRNLDEAYTVLCTSLALDASGWSVWRMIRNVLGRSTNNDVDGDLDTDFERMLVRSLACSTQPVMLRNFVALLGNMTMRPYRSDIYAAAARNPISRWFVLEYLFENAASNSATNISNSLIANSNNDDDNDDIDDGMLEFFRHLSTPMEFEMLQRIFEVYPQLSLVSERADQARWKRIVASIRANIAWKRRLDTEWNEIEEAIEQ